MLMRRGQFFIFGIITIFFLTHDLISKTAQFDTTHVTNRVYNSGANMPAFQQDVLTTYNGYQYSTFWSADKSVCVARRKLGSRQWQVVELTDYKSNHNLSDEHYSISMGICPGDGTLHLSFDQHSDQLHYRKSVTDLANHPENFEWTGALFEPTTYRLASRYVGTVTYPRFAAAPDGKLLFVCRIGTSGNGDSHLWEYDGTTGEWMSLGIFIDGVASGENPYLNGVHFDPFGKLHVSWCWRGTPDPTTNHDIYYACSEDQGRTWKNTKGEHVGTTGAKATALRRDTPDLKVWTIPQNRGLINQESQIVDSQGRIHILMSHLDDSEPSTTDFWGARSRAYNFHYYRDLDGVWHRNPLNALVNGRNPIGVDANDNLFAVLGKARIYGATAASGWQWKLLDDQTKTNLLIGEGAMDRQRLNSENVLSYVYVEHLKKLVVFDVPIEGLLTGVASEAGKNREAEKTPWGFSLFQNYPNPFNLNTEIQYEMNQPGHVEISIFDLNGRFVINLIDELQSAGLKRINWDGSDQSGNVTASGIYFLRARFEQQVEIEKIILQK